MGVYGYLNEMPKPSERSGLYNDWMRVKKYYNDMPIPTRLSIAYDLLRSRRQTDFNGNFIPFPMEDIKTIAFNKRMIYQVILLDVWERNKRGRLLAKKNDTKKR